MTSPLRMLQENDRVPLRGALLIALSAVLVSAGAVGVSVLLAGSRPSAARVSGPSASATSMPEQSLIERTERGLDLRRAQQREFERYEWVDGDAGIVRIPIERAIDLAAERAR